MNKCESLHMIPAELGVNFAPPPPQILAQFEAKPTPSTQSLDLSD